MDDNLSRQADEIEALSAIYGEEWCELDDSARTYLININDKPENTQNSISLQVQLPTDYPTISPPEYCLSAPWLRGEKRARLGSELEQIYAENIGEPIIYLWVERVREFLQELTDEEKGPGSANGSILRNETLEIEDDDEEDDSFDLENLQIDFSSRSRETVMSTPEGKSGFECPEIYHGEPFTERRSTFQAHLAEVFYKEQIKLVLRSLYENKKIANATHNILAYRIHIAEPHDHYLQGCDDDGEHHAGSRILHMMQITDVRNVMVVVTRWYGGILLGPDRYKFINNAARQMLEQKGFIKDKGEKKGPKSSNSGKKSSKHR